MSRCWPYDALIDLPPMPRMELPILMLFDVLERGAVREPLTGMGSFWRRYGVRGMSQL